MPQLDLVMDCATVERGPRASDHQARRCTFRGRGAGPILKTPGKIELLIPSPRLGIKLNFSSSNEILESGLPVESTPSEEACRGTYDRRPS